jgi:acyl-CoA thioesterase
MASRPQPVAGTAETGLPELLTLERIEDDLFRTVVVSREPAGLFGGQPAGSRTPSTATS